MTEFFITIPGNDGDLRFKVLYEVNMMNFKRFKIKARNGTVEFEKHIPKSAASYWKIVAARLPKTKAGELHLQNMQKAIESWLYSQER
jgi:hypothetical protein